MLSNDRFRVRILTALGLGLVACEGGKEPATPSASPSPPPPPSLSPSPSPSPSPSEPTNPTEPKGTILGRGDAKPTCLPAETGAPKTGSKAFGDCAASIEGKCCGPAGGTQSCRKPIDEDATRADRAKGGPPTCCYQANDTGCLGRPLRAEIDGPPIVARSVRVSSFEEPRDRTAGERWLRDAASEHASIASFAITSLQLLALGAPPELVADTHRAALDEIEHTRLSLEIASRLLGVSHAMGPLDVPAFDRASCSFAEIARGTFRDAACSETVAAMRARDEAERESDPAIRGVLLRIAEDEARHAELGWRTVAWLVAEGGAAAREAVSAELERIRTTAARDAVLRDVVVPCAEALLMRTRPRAYGDEAPAT